MENGPDVVDRNYRDLENRGIRRFKKTLTVLNNLSRDHQIHYILIKTLNTIPNIPNDVDVFVRRGDRLELIDLLKDHGMECAHASITETKLKGDLMRIDIYTEIGYLGREYLDGDFLWRSRVMGDVLGVRHPKLNNEADLLLLVPHALFGHRRITLLDFLHMKELMATANLDACREFASEKGWQTVLDETLGILAEIENKIYEKGETVDFPYLFDRGLILRCIDSTSRLSRVERRRRTLLHISFIQDEISHKLLNTPLYDLLKSSELVRYLVNSSSAFIKVLRGDRKSVGE